MKTLEQTFQAIKEKTSWERECNAMLDNRDIYRLLDFVSSEKVSELGFTAKSTWEDFEDWTEKNILSHMERDYWFACEKADDQRGISSSLMFEVMKMWMWILEQDWAKEVEYGSYGYSLYKLIAEKYDLK